MTNNKPGRSLANRSLLRRAEHHNASPYGTNETGKSFITVSIAVVVGSMFLIGLVWLAWRLAPVGTMASDQATVRPGGGNASTKAGVTLWQTTSGSRSADALKHNEHLVSLVAALRERRVIAIKAHKRGIEETIAESRCRLETATLRHNHALRLELVSP